MEVNTVTIDHPADLKALGERPWEGRTQHNQWHALLSGGRVSTIADLQQVVGELGSDIAYITRQKDSFEIAVPKFRDALVRMVRISADAAISSVLRFGDALLVTPYAGRKTVARTRGLALRTQREFRTVHEYAHEALGLATDLGVEIAYWRTCAEDCTRGLGECRAIAGASVDGSHARFAQAQGLIAAAERECADTQKAHDSAKRWWDQQGVFTVFLVAQAGPAGETARARRDAVEATKNAMRTAQENLATVQAQQDVARAELDAWRAEQPALEDVSARLQELGPALSLAGRTLDEHHARLTDGAKTAHDVGVFFGGLVARTAEWGIITSAPALAEAVVKLQQLLETNTRLTGVFITSPALLNDALRHVADSNVPPDWLSALM
ncbi:hypothetical protein V8E53_006016 [Lactarius tabidus]